MAKSNYISILSSEDRNKLRCFTLKRPGTVITKQLGRKEAYELMDQDAHELDVNECLEIAANGGFHFEDGRILTATKH